MRNKKITLEEYCKIKVDIEYVFFLFPKSKTKYTFQTPKINYNLYKTHKSTTSDLTSKS